MGIFISYRRSDSAPWAGRIYDSLVDIWGEDQVYMDIDTIAPGDDFRLAIAETLGRSDVVLVIIGPSWLSATDEDGKRRLDDRSDVHRSEIVSALNRDMRIIPVLVGGAPMPEASELPTAIRRLAFRNAVEIDDRHFRSHLEALQESLERFAEELAEQRARESDAPTRTEDVAKPTQQADAGAVAAAEPNRQHIDHATERAAPVGPSSAEDDSAAGQPHEPSPAPSRHRWPASVLVGSVAIGALAGLVAAIALVAARDDDSDGDANAAATTAPSPASITSSPASGGTSSAPETTPVAVQGESFVVFETDRDDPAPAADQRRHSIWRVDANGSDAHSLIKSSGSDGHPTLSSDGTRVAYLHTETPAEAQSWQLVVANIDGSSPRVLAEAVGRTYRPAWSPDDTAIVIPLLEDDQVDLWRIDLATGERHQITDTPEAEYDPDWSSSGLVFRRDIDGDNAEIFTSDTDGSNARRLTEHAGYDSDPRWSPDGSLILFTRTFGPGNLEVCVMRKDGGEFANLTNAPGNDQDAMWLPVDGGIVFVSDRDGGSQIFLMGSDGSDQRRLVSSAGRDGVPDGR